MPGPEDQLTSLDVGQRLAMAQRLYRGIVENQETAENMVRQVNAMIYEAKTKGSGSKAQEAITQANDILAEMELELAETRVLRAKALLRTINAIGSTLSRVKGIRAKISLGEVGFGPGFDSDLAGLEQRYKQVYRPMFPIGPGGIVELPDVGLWDEQDWAKFDDMGSNPIYFWNIRECEENWSVHGVPPCEGPDYLMAMSLVNQVMEAWKNQILMKQDFPIISFADEVLGGYLEEFHEIVQSMEKLLEQAKSIMRNVITVVEETSKALASTPGLILLAGGVGIFLLTRKR